MFVVVLFELPPAMLSSFEADIKVVAGKNERKDRSMSAAACSPIR